jgi:hypothetical protein
MTPIQLWLPTFFGGVARPQLRRDMQRMFRARTSERVMWSVPGWTGPSRWMQDGTRVSCLNGECPECVRILHIGANGVVVGPAAASFPGLSVSGLLDAWLNDDFVRAESRPSGGGHRVDIPDPAPGGVRMCTVELTIPGEIEFPITHLDDGAAAAIAQWPPRPGMPATVSPEMESVSLGRRSSNESLKLRIAWLAPFNGMQPLVVSADDMFARAKMQEIANDSGDDQEGACARAVIEARDWVTEGQASWNEAWLQPIIATEGEVSALIAIESRFGVSAGSLEEAYKIRDLRARLSAPIPVTRAWGVPGLMWALLLDRLSAARPYRTCERCGKLLSGRGHKRFCSAADNPECFRGRKAQDKRQGRGRSARRR